MGVKRYLALSKSNLGTLTRKLEPKETCYDQERGKAVRYARDQVLTASKILDIEDKFLKRRVKRYLGRSELNLATILKYYHEHESERSSANFQKRGAIAWVKNYYLVQTSGKRWHLYMSTQEEDTQRNFNGNICQSFTTGCFFAQNSFIAVCMMCQVFNSY